jgi:hypothetical protein
MPISYPLTLPAVTGAGFAQFQMTLRRVVAVAASPFTGQQQVYRHPGAWWETDFRTTQLPDRARSEPWVAFHASLRGQEGTFLMGDPLRQSLRGTGGGTPVVSGANAANATTLNVRGLPTNATNVWRAGDVIQLGTGVASRLHMVVSDAASNASGQAAVDIEPPLRTAYPDGATIVTAGARGVWRLTSNTLGYTVTPSTLTEGLALSCVEAL